MNALSGKIRFPLGWLVTGALAIATLSPTVAFAQNTIQACANNTNGNLRQVSAVSDCRQSETPLSWNIVGPIGPAGPRGPTGATGPISPTAGAYTITFTPGAFDNAALVTPIAMRLLDPTPVSVNIGEGYKQFRIKFLGPSGAGLDSIFVFIAGQRS